MKSNANTGLQGLKIVSFESRRAREIGELIRRYGGEALIAPSMREIPLDQNSAALDFVRQVEAGKIDIVIFLTGVGIRSLIEAVADGYPRKKLAAALERAALVARGPKPLAVLKELGLQPVLAVREPNTWREILSELDAKFSLQGQRIAVQEYGISNQELLAGLARRGAEVLPVSVYRWALPEDTGPLRSALNEIIAGRIDIALFTNATQVVHLFKLAAQENLEESLRRGLKRVVVASIGPVCSETLGNFGLSVDIEPDHPKMGHLLAAMARRGQTLVGEKREKHFKDRDC